MTEWSHYQDTLHLVEPRGTRGPPPVLRLTGASFEWSLLLPHPAMATRLLFWVALCLLGVGESQSLRFCILLIFPVLFPFMFLILSVPYSVLFNRAHTCWSHPEAQA